ncbi:MAG: hypothetical protein KDC05_09230 [Bacteroidales bacterium]|nr:hypothetical protein [Bacteroidales bacterium]
MDRSHRDSHRRSRKKGGRIFRRLKRFFKQLFVGDSAPKEYRPYLGPSADQKEIEEKTYENTRVSPKKYTRRKPKSTDANKVSLGDRWTRYLEKRKKRKHKNKMKRKYRKKQRRRARIEFIRRFIPQYKKSEFVNPEITQIENIDEKEKVKPRSNLVYTVNSTIVFIIAYLLVYIIYQLTVLVVASHWKLDSVLFYYDLAFNDYSPLWNRMNIIATTLSGPLVSLLIGIILMRLVVPRIVEHKTTKLLMIWIAIHGYNFFLGAFATGVSFDEGFGYVPAWLFMNTFWKILLSMIFLFILGLIGYYSAPRFLETSYSLSRIRQPNKIKFLFFQVALPWLIGITIIFLVKIPNNMNYDTANLITLVFVVAPVLFNRNAKPQKDFKSLKKPNRLKWVYLAVLIILLLAFRIGLNDGLHFKLFYKFIFSLEVIPL